MISSWFRLFAVIILVLALCNQGGVVSAALAAGVPVASCCPMDADAAPEEDGCCEQPECQCISCLNIVLTDSPGALAGLDEAGKVYHVTVSTLRGDVYRTIDYPPETA